MALSTAKTYLYYDSTGTPTWTKLVDIINYPDLGSTPSKIDTTDLSQDKYKTNILGLQESPDLTFEANYDEDAYELISALSGEQDFQLWFGEAGANGKFQWSGNVSIFVMGGGVDEARKMQVTLSASTPITKVTV